MGDKFDAEIDDTTDDIHREPINNEFRHSIDQHKGATDTIIEVQKCLLGELYYTQYKIYSDDPDESIIRIAHLTNVWSLCDSAPSFKNSPMLRSELAYNQ